MIISHVSGFLCGFFLPLIKTQYLQTCVSDKINDTSHQSEAYTTDKDSNSEIAAESDIALAFLLKHLHS